MVDRGHGDYRRGSIRARSERQKMKEQLYFAPARSYSGKVIVRKLGLTTDTRGQTMVMVQALHGEPWSDWTSGGYAMTARAKFYPESVVPVDEVDYNSEQGAKNE